MSTTEVTITLGRSRKVVKRKRSDFTQSLPCHSKRLRIIVKENVDYDGFHLERNDLHHKLIRRRLSSRNHTTARGNKQRRKLTGKLSGASARSAISYNELLRGLHQSQRDGHIQRDPYREATRALAYMGSLEHPSTVTKDDLRRRSPTRPAYNSGCLLPPTHTTELQKVTSIRSSQHAYSHMFPGPPRSTVPVQTGALLDPERARPMALIPSPSGFLPRSMSMVEAPVTVAGLLNSLGLGKYAIHFRAEEVDMSALKLMNEKDLKDLGILMDQGRKSYRLSQLNLGGNCPGNFSRLNLYVPFVFSNYNS